MTDKEQNPLIKLALEFGPLAIFFLTYRMYSEDTVTLFGSEYKGVVLATVAFIPAILISLAISWFINRELPRMAVVTAVVVVVFGGLTIWLNDATFIKMKPTIVNSVFALVLGWGLLRGQSYLKSLMGQMLPLTDAGWMILTKRWAMFFVFMAIVNEVVWRTQSESFWVNFKIFGSLGLTFGFLALQSKVVKQHLIETE
ncbi:MAG: septation protein A [Pikeienuella sp.]